MFCSHLSSGGVFDIILIVMDSDNDDIFWFLAGYIAGGGDSSIRPRDRWDVVAYAVIAIGLVLLFALAIL